MVIRNPSRSIFFSGTLSSLILYEAVFITANPTLFMPIQASLSPRSAALKRATYEKSPDFPSTYSTLLSTAEVSRCFQSMGRPYGEAFALMMAEVHPRAEAQHIAIQHKAVKIRLLSII